MTSSPRRAPVASQSLPAGQRPRVHIEAASPTLDRERRTRSSPRRRRWPPTQEPRQHPLQATAIPPPSGCPDSSNPRSTRRGSHSSRALYPFAKTARSALFTKAARKPARFDPARLAPRFRTNARGAAATQARDGGARRVGAVQACSGSYGSSRSAAAASTRCR